MDVNLPRLRRKGGGVRARGTQLVYFLVTYLRSALACTRVSDPSSSQRFHFRFRSFPLYSCCLQLLTLAARRQRTTSFSQGGEAPGGEGGCSLLFDETADAEGGGCATLKGGSGRYYINTWWRISERRVLDRVLGRRMGGENGDGDGRNEGALGAS